MCLGRQHQEDVDKHVAREKKQQRDDGYGQGAWVGRGSTVEGGRLVERQAINQQPSRSVEPNQDQGGRDPAARCLATDDTGPAGATSTKRGDLEPKEQLSNGAPPKEEGYG